MTCACDGLEYGMTEEKFYAKPENHENEEEYHMEQKQKPDRPAQSRLCQERDRLSEEPNTICITARLQDVEYRSFSDFADTYWVRCEESESETACCLIRNRRSRSEPTQIVCVAWSTSGSGHGARDCLDFTTGKQALQQPPYVLPADKEFVYSFSVCSVSTMVFVFS